jgi:hypothetical protein
MSQTAAVPPLLGGSVAMVCSDLSPYRPHQCVLAVQSAPVLDAVAVARSSRSAG